MMDYFRLGEKLNPKPDGESAVRHRTGVVDAVNADGTVDLDLGGVVVPSVSVLDGASIAVADVVQIVAWSGDLLILGRAAVSAAEHEWIAWTPTLVNLNIGSTGTQVARYTQIGNTVTYLYQATLGGAGISVGAVGVSLPVTPAAHYLVNVSFIGNTVYLEAGVAHYVGMARIGGSINTAALRNIGAGGAFTSTAALSSTTPFTWGAGDVMEVTGTYEAA